MRCQDVLCKGDGFQTGLNGDMGRLPGPAGITSRIRPDIIKKGDSRRAIAGDNASDFKIINGVEAERVLQTVYVTPRANFESDFPILPRAESLQDLSKLRNLVDLDKVIVNTGFAEVGPWSSSRTRWEMEVRGDFMLEGWVEMAWIMGTSSTSMVASRMVRCTSVGWNRSPVKLSTRKT